MLQQITQSAALSGEVRTTQEKDMGKKHEQRTRAEILAKRAKPIMGFDKRRAPITAPVSRSKYTPHFGLKQQAKLQRNALKLAA